MDLATLIVAMLCAPYSTFAHTIEKTIVKVPPGRNLSDIILQLNDNFHPKVDALLSSSQNLAVFSSSTALKNLYLQTLDGKVQGMLSVSSTERLKNYSVERRVRRSQRSDEPPINLHLYNSYENILSYLLYVSRRYSELCTLYSIGRTYERREIYVLKISATKDEKRKPKVFIEAGQHAREWISPAATLNLIQMVLDEYTDGNEVVSSFVEHYELHILPLLNPDGYAYTYAADGERLWRKNRKPSEVCSEDSWVNLQRGNASDTQIDCPCLGVDLNRNWDYQWGGIGGSSSWCSSVFRGKYCFSEEETVATASYISSQTGWHSYFSLHSFGQMILLPWSRGQNQNLDYMKLMNAGRALAKGIYQTSNKIFSVGATGDIVYDATGTSKQWAYRAHRFPYAYTIELTKDNFILPARDIAPTSLDILNGLLAYFDYIEWNDNSYRDFLDALYNESTVALRPHHTHTTLSEIYSDTAPIIYSSSKVLTSITTLQVILTLMPL